LWNETRDAGFYYCIQSLSGLNSIDFVERALRKCRDVEILSGACSALGCGEQSCAALDGPSQQHLGRRLSDTRGDGHNDWVFERPWPRPVA
jgi:hypothetical protein